MWLMLQKNIFLHVLPRTPTERSLVASGLYHGFQCFLEQRQKQRVLKQRWLIKLIIKPIKNKKVI